MILNKFKRKKTERRRKKREYSKKVSVTKDHFKKEEILSFLKEKEKSKKGEVKEMRVRRKERSKMDGEVGKKVKK